MAGQRAFQKEVHKVKDTIISKTAPCNLPKTTVELPGGKHTQVPKKELRDPPPSASWAGWPLSIQDTKIKRGIT